MDELHLSFMHVTYGRCSVLLWWPLHSTPLTGRAIKPGARCTFAYGPADATATHYFLLQYIEIDFTFLDFPFWYQLTRTVQDKVQGAIKWL